MKRRERGASLLIPVVLIVVTAGAFAVVVAAGQSGADMDGTNAQADSAEALFLAETGIERATRNFLAGSACAGLSENLTNLATIGIASGRTITITAGANSNRDFSNVLLPATQCRIQVTGQVTASNVSRTLQAIIDRADNLIGSPLVAGFDNPAGTANAAASWTGAPVVPAGAIGSFDHTGGNIAGAVNPPNCTRSAYLVKPNAGVGTPAASSVGTAPVAFTIDRPVAATVVLVSFDYRMVRIRDANNDTCGTNSPGALSCTISSPTVEPGAGSPEGNGGDGEICFTLRDTAGVIYNSTRAEVDASVNNSAAGNPVVTPAVGCQPTNQQAPADPDFAPCSRRYNFSGGTAAADLRPATVRFTFAGPAAPVSFDQVGFKMYRAGGGNAFEMWLDNIRVTVNAPMAGIAGWRDCSVTATNPLLSVCPPVI
jgi:hypothetical protein